MVSVEKEQVIKSFDETGIKIVILPDSSGNVNLTYMNELALKKLPYPSFYRS